MEPRQLLRVRVEDKNDLCTWLGENSQLVEPQEVIPLHPGDMNNCPLALDTVTFIS